MFESEFERLLNGYRDSIGIRSRFSGLVKDFFPGQRIFHKSCDIKISTGKKGAAPVIAEEKGGVIQYGELFQYERSSLGDGLAVTGFTGINNQTIIFQNTSKNVPVVEIKAGAFSESSIEEAIMTEGFRRIGEKAFLGCVNLKQIIFPDVVS